MRLTDRTKKEEKSCRWHRNNMNAKNEHRSLLLLLLNIINIIIAIIMTIMNGSALGWGTGGNQREILFMDLGWRENIIAKELSEFNWRVSTRQFKNINGTTGNHNERVNGILKWKWFKMLNVQFYVCCIVNGWIKYDYNRNYFCLVSLHSRLYSYKEVYVEKDALGDCL